MDLFSPGIVYLVGAGPGDPGLITLRGVECLRQAGVVIHDRLINHSLLRYAPKAQWIDVGKQPDHHPIPQSKINALLVEHSRAGHVVVRLKGGDPFVFGRGGEEAMALVEAGLPFEIIPGISSAIAAPAYAGIPITHRNLACSAAIITGHRADCKEGPEKEGPESDWTRAAKGCDTLVFLMGVKTLACIVESVLASGRSPQTPVALISAATSRNQKVVIGSLENIVERSAGVSSPAVIVVGEVVDLHNQLDWYRCSQSRPLAGLCVLNTRPGSIDDNPLDGYTDEFSLRLSELGSHVLEMPASQAGTKPDTGALLAAVRGIRTTRSSTGVLPLQSPAAGGRPYDWLVFTSADCAAYFFEALFACGADSRECAGLKLAAVNKSTAASLRRFGLTADFMPAHVGAIHLACELPDPAGQRVLMLLSEIDSNEPAEVLRQRGAYVEPVRACTVQPLAYDPGVGKTLLESEYDLVTFFSPTAIEGFKTIADPNPLDVVLRGHTIACADEATARAVHAAGLWADVVAEDPTVEGMLEALVKWRGR